MTKRFAGTNFLDSDSVVGSGFALLGCCVARALRRLDCGFGVGFCEEDGWGVKKRCGEGVCIGISIATFDLSGNTQCDVLNPMCVLCRVK